MAEKATIMIVKADEVKQLIAEKYHVDPKSIKFWNGRYEFMAPDEDQKED